MRKATAISLLVTALILLVVLSVWPPPAPIQFSLDRATPIGAMNGKEYVQFTFSIRNRSAEEIVFNPKQDIQVRIAGRWTEVDQVFSGTIMKPGQTEKKRLYLPVGAEICRLQFSFYSRYPKSTWMAQLLDKLGPKAVNLVAKSSSLRAWIWPEQAEPGTKEIVPLEVEIPPVR